VKFLVDVNLPPRLCRWLHSRGHDARHLGDLNLLTATDSEIWQRGRVETAVLVSKDNDFYNRALLFGASPQVLHIDVGNCSNNLLLEILTSSWSEIDTALSSGSRLVSVTQQGIEIFP
jgi:predicted nuclease of predicted toxin-antitoxin system